MIYMGLYLTIMLIGFIIAFILWCLRYFAVTVNTFRVESQTQSTKRYQREEPPVAEEEEKKEEGKEEMDEERRKLVEEHKKED